MFYIVWQQTENYYKNRKSKITPNKQQNNRDINEVIYGAFQVHNFR